MLADSLIRTPIFCFDSLTETIEFARWIAEKQVELKAIAQSTTRYGTLVAIEPIHMGSKICLRFVFQTGDASGQNMTTIATQAMLEYIRSQYPGKIFDSFLECNISGDKKANAYNYTRNRGKKVVAEVAITEQVITNILHTTAERIRSLHEGAILGSLFAHAMGAQAHYANSLAALFIATGQDPACIAECAVGVTQVDFRPGQLIVSVTLPCLMVGTVGGGTRLSSQKNCLDMLGCAGAGKALKFAEIVAATVLAGEISIMGAMASDKFAQAHAEYGRSEPH